MLPPGIFPLPGEGKTAKSFLLVAGRMSMSVYARSLMKKPNVARMAVWLVPPPLCAAALGVLSFILMVPASADSVLTEPIGFNKITCPPNSDTIVGLPLRAQGSRTTSLTATPVVNGDLATLEVSIASFEAGDFARRYVKFTSGSKNGHWYHVDEAASAGAGKLVIDLNGDTLTGVGSGDGLLIAEYWTLDSLFPPAQGTSTWTETPPGSNVWVPSGHAIVKSSSVLSRRTEVLVPDYTGQGINLAAAATYYILSNSSGDVWRKFGSSSLTEGSTILYPDGYLIIRHNSTVSRATTFRCLGEVESGSLAIPLSTRTSGKQDNFVAIPRPLPVTLAGLGLDTTAFVNSSSALNRTDELLVFDNDTAVRNKAPSATYFRLSSGWRKFGDGSTPHDTTTLPAGAGFIIRKAARPDGATVFWTNPPTY